MSERRCLPSLSYLLLSKRVEAFGAGFEQQRVCHRSSRKNSVKGSGTGNQEGSKLRWARSVYVLNVLRLRSHEALNAGANRLVSKLMSRWLSNLFEEFPVRTAERSVGLSRLSASEFVSDPRRASSHDFHLGFRHSASLVYL